MRNRLAVGLLTLLAAALIAGPARAATITVTTTEDEVNTDGDCSLREAIVAANSDAAVDACPAGSGDDVIVLPAGTYVLAIAGINENFGLTGDLDISTNLAIRGAGAAVTIVDGGSLDRVFHIITTRTVAMSDLTIRNGRTTGFGGGINGSGGLTLTDVVLRDNQAAQGGAMLFGVGPGSQLTMTSVQVLNNSATCHGGGVQVTGPSTVIRATVIAGNRAGGGCIGGGGFLSGTTEITDTTVADNTAGGSAGGLFVGDTTMSRVTVSNNVSGNLGGGLMTSGSNVRLTGVTVSGNMADSGGGIRVGAGASLDNVTITGNHAAPTSQSGGGVSIPTSVAVTARNTIIAGNTDLGTSPAPDCQGPLTSLGHNLIGDATGCTVTAAAGDLLGTAASPVEPLLAALADNGGSTLTHLPQAGSPAIDAGDPGGTCAATDQRRFARVGRCDIGAAEAGSPGPPVDTYLCYGTRSTRGAPRFTPELGVSLVDELQSLIANVTRPAGLCSPAALAGGSVNDPAVSLEAYQIAPSRTTPPQPRHVVQHLRVTDAVHGAGTELLLDTVRPDQLLVPTAASLGGPAGPLPPAAVDHYACYQVRATRGAPRFTAIPGVVVDDELVDAATALDIRRPTRACLPVDIEGRGVQNPAQALMCYQVTAARGAPRFTAVTGIGVETWLGEEQLDAIRLDQLCVPSTVVPAGP